MRRRELRELHQSVKQLRHEMDLVRAELHQTKFLDLDISSVEAKVEESTQQLEMMVQEEVESLSRDIEDLDERLEVLEGRGESIESTAQYP